MNIIIPNIPVSNGGRTETWKIVDASVNSPSVDKNDHNQQNTDRKDLRKEDEEESSENIWSSNLRVNNFGNKNVQKIEWINEPLEN